MISLKIDWFDLLAVQGTLRSLLQHHSSKASILRRSAFLIVQLSHPHVTTGKNITLTVRTFVGKVMSLLFYSPTHSPCPCLCPHSCLCQALPSLFSPASPSLTARICSGDKLPLRGGCPGFQGPLHFPLLAHYSHLHSLCLLLSHNAFTHCMPPTSALPRLEQGSLGCDSAAYRETPGGCLHQQHSQPSNRMGKEWVIAKLLGRSCVSPASHAFRVA